MYLKCNVYVIQQHFNNTVFLKFIFAVMLDLHYDVSSCFDKLLQMKTVMVMFVSFCFGVVVS